LYSDGGTIRNSYAYTAWGVPLDWRETISNRYTYTSREYDVETQQYCYRKRQYDPDIGRFGSRENHIYRYVGNSPTNFSDPYGMHRKVSNLPKEPRGGGVTSKFVPRITIEVLYIWDCSWADEREKEKASQYLRQHIVVATDRWGRVAITLRFKEAPESVLESMFGACTKERTLRKKSKEEFVNLMAQDWSKWRPWASVQPTVVYITKLWRGAPASSAWYSGSWVAGVTFAWGKDKPLVTAHELAHVFSWSTRTEIESCWRPLIQEATGVAARMPVDQAPCPKALDLIYENLHAATYGVAHMVKRGRKNLPRIPVRGVTFELEDKPWMPRWNQTFLRCMDKSHPVIRVEEELVAELKTVLEEVIKRYLKKFKR